MPCSTNTPRTASSKGLPRKNVQSQSTRRVTTVSWNFLTNKADFSQSAVHAALQKPWPPFAEETQSGDQSKIRACSHTIEPNTARAELQQVFFLLLSMACATTCHPNKIQVCLFCTAKLLGVEQKQIKCVKEILQSKMRTSW